MRLQLRNSGRTVPFAREERGVPVRTHQPRTRARGTRRLTRSEGRAGAQPWAGTHQIGEVFGPCAEVVTAVSIGRLVDDDAGGFSP
jgi:hypothetical protein